MGLDSPPPPAEPLGFESVSTWRQPAPPPVSDVRSALVGEVAERIVALGTHRHRVAIDGLTAAGKTSFGHELAEAIRRMGRPTLRACFDDFKKPWRDAIEKGYDRTSGAGYYRNAPDFASARELLLKPAAPNGSGRVALCGHDPLTGQDHRTVVVDAPHDAVLIVDSVFAFRPDYNDHWDYRIWLDVEVDTSLARAIDRDAEMEGGRAEAEHLHRSRYLAAEVIYINEVNPRSLADLIIDNNDFANPSIVAD